MKHTWVIDIDGAITSNTFVFSWLTYYLNKADQQVVILTGRNPSRKAATESYLSDHNIYYNAIIFMDEAEPRGFANIGEWKLHQIIELKPLIWFDNNIKDYKEFHPELAKQVDCIQVSL